MEYYCFDCGRKVDSEDLRRRIRCPFCGGKVLFKKRPEVTKTMKAR